MICCSANILNILSPLWKAWCAPYLEKGKCGCPKKPGSYMVLSVSFIYNHSLTMVQCIKLRELNLQQQLTESPRAFRKIMLSKIRVSPTDTYEFFLHISFESKKLICCSYTAHRRWLCMFESSSILIFEQMLQHTSELTGRKPLTLDARNYIATPKI